MIEYPSTCIKEARMKRHLKEVVAEIGNGTVYINQYDPGSSYKTKSDGSKEIASGSEWVPFAKANRISPATKNVIKNIVNGLKPEEKKELMPYTPAPTPDIQTFGNRAVVSFPNGRQKSILL